VNSSSPTTSLPSASPPAAIVLAAGKGTRMGSDLPKVLHAAAGGPMVRHVVAALRGVAASPIVLVVGHGADLVREAFAGEADLRFAMQAEQLGTGHAVQCGVAALADADPDRTILVLCGDGPLVQASTLRTLLAAHADAGAAATLATSRVADPAGYGRIARDAAGRFRAIVEDRDASDAERAIDEINPSVYAFRLGALLEALPRLGRQNAKGEIYLTDAFGLLVADGETVAVVEAVPAEEVLSVNTPAQLAEVDAILRARGAAAEAGR
jgi:bifunctional UDP-N-acetylglucosamine pyrophosphorylase/glucosamine-1-phosphate N-acetyltransferase